MSESPLRSVRSSSAWLRTDLGPNATMKAVVLRPGRGLSSMEIQQVPVPRLGASEVLVRVRAAGVNASDASPGFGFRQLLCRPFIPGWDFAGVVIALGPRVHEYQIGDEVFGLADPAGTGGGSYAEYVVVSPRRLCRKPAALTFEQAATLPLTALTVYRALIDVADVRRGERVLVLGGAGGAGPVAVQLAKALGAEVVATCSTSNVQFVSSLGADRVIDFTATDFENALPMFSVDVVIDTVGAPRAMWQKSQLLLKARTGRFVCVGLEPRPHGSDTPDTVSTGRYDQREAVPWSVRVRDSCFTLRRTFGRLIGENKFALVTGPTLDRLPQCAQHASMRLLRPVVSQTYSLAEAVEAHAHNQTHTVKGKLALVMERPREPAAHAPTVHPAVTG